MSALRPIAGLDKSIQFLLNALAKGKLPRSMLFVGPAGAGKQKTAILLAQRINCRHLPDISGSYNHNSTLNEGYPLPCGKCRACQRIASGNHPDVMIVSPEKDSIRIEQIRSVIRILKLKPYEATNRMTIIDCAHQMTPSSANALLKVLEEPPDHTFIVLLTTQTSDLLPTIVSRCQRVRFDPAEPSTVNPEKQYAGLLDKLIHWERLSLKEKLAFGAQIALDSSQITDKLEMIKIWLRDLIIFRWNPGKTENRDRQKILQERANRIRMPKLIQAADAVVAAQKQVQRHANPRLVMDTLILRLSRLTMM